ncbi:CRISPR-associated endonuclease Cas2 [Desulfoglaeba alkanexedens]|jgi:CRISPR-associated protein Cas2|uniref:CRISPR-associated endoribonuclease Cas2 n=1 Tax=Desulfoglaeba alkanexedens ALDC TaxID=980445 RepID=A0A4P8L4A1_9BACT|nr:CRISPR-associated endonuclease Cas2 [Desulfoglaeba alkanexedens]QCQ22816.1 CRISPR-associated endonuclease Cas2 [Desulfoglaeba alkanexedens ALDC]
MKRNYLVGYDISDPKRLQKVAKVMKEYGSRVQYSFFHCSLSTAQKKRMMDRIRTFIREDEDQVLILPVTETQLKEMEFIGLKSRLDMEGVLIF